MAEKNQKVMWIDRHDAGATNYIKIGDLDFFSAYKRLTYVGIGVYMYICCQVPNSYDGKKNEKNNRPRPFELSPQAIANFTGMARSSVQKGIQNLVENGYIYCIDEEMNLYQFIDILPEDRGQTIQEHESIKQYSLEKGLSQLQEKRENQLHTIADRTLFYLSNGHLLNASSFINKEEYKNKTHEELQEMFEQLLKQNMNLEKWYIS